MSRGSRLLMLVAASAMALPGRSSAQGPTVDVAVTQGVSSVDALASPTGVEFGVSTGSMWTDLGLRVSFRSLSEAGTRIAQRCGAFFCEDGPFDRLYRLRTASAGVTYRPWRPTRVDVALVATATFSKQSLRLTRPETGETSSRDEVGPDMGVGVGVDLGLTPLAWGFRPRVSLRYERITASECLADAACYGGRNVGTIGVGLAWRVGR